MKILLEHLLLKIKEAGFGTDRGNKASKKPNGRKFDQQAGHDQSASGAQSSEDGILMETLIQSRVDAGEHHQRTAHQNQNRDYSMAEVTCAMIVCICSIRASISMTTIVGTRRIRSFNSIFCSFCISAVER